MANPLKKKTIIVPWDSSQGCGYALEHAFQLAQAVGDNVMILQLVKRPGMLLTRVKRSEFEQQLAEQRQQLEREAQRLNMEFAEKRAAIIQNLKTKTAAAGREFQEVTITSMVLDYRSLVHSLNELVLTLSVNLFVTSQYYQLSRTTRLDLLPILRKMKSSKVDTTPFIIVNKPPKHLYYTELVVPMEYVGSYKETLRWVAYLSTYYHCNVNLIKPPLKDESKRRGMANNLYFTKKILDSKNVVYGIKTANKRAEFNQEVFSFVSAIEADLLILMANNMKNYFADRVVKSEVPILFINPLSKKYQAFK